jgi:hypothetical protein
MVSRVQDVYEGCNRSCAVCLQEQIHKTDSQMVGTRDLAPPMDGGAITTRVLRNAKSFVESAKCLSHR